MTTYNSNCIDTSLLEAKPLPPPWQKPGSGGGGDGVPGPQGPPGPAGQNATVTVGSVTTGSPLQVWNSGTATNAVLNFQIPEGPQGPPGDPGEGITLGSPTPPTTPNLGEIWTTDAGEVFVWRGTFWLQIA